MSYSGTRLLPRLHVFASFASLPYGHLPSICVHNTTWKQSEYYRYMWMQTEGKKRGGLEMRHVRKSSQLLSQAPLLQNSNIEVVQARHI